ncbi:MAG TPA: hypothetical protein VHM26_07295 [Chitinophagaceae bacterium]|jgi:hypothetical protein|nr:hypothetical protein [Chitinophagaceae bacterium]
MQMILRDQRRFITLIILLLIAGLASAQDSSWKRRDSLRIAKYYKPHHIIWVTPTNAKSINGIAIGVQATPLTDKPLTINGINIDFGAVGFIALPTIVLLSVMNETQSDEGSLYAEEAEVFLNGISLSIGGEISCGINGINASGLITHAAYINGFSFSGILSMTNSFKGIVIGSVVNVANKGVGLQIGLINRCKKLKGLQLGLWNISGKRGLPVINWGI